MSGEPGESRVEQRTGSELVKLVRKLRWMGMDEEAEKLQLQLRRMPPAEGVLLSPDTD